MTIFVLLMLAGTFVLGVDDVLKRKYIHEGFETADCRNLGITLVLIFTL